MTGYPLFRAVADHAVLVEFGAVPGPEVLAQVRHLDRMLLLDGFAGFVEAVPAFVNVLVTFDPVQTNHLAVERVLRGLMNRAETAMSEPVLREVEVCYDPDLAPDLAEVAKACGMTTEAVIAAHLAGNYAVIMYGFAPGYAYLSGVPEPLHLPRKLAAVRGVAAGSVIIAGAQCLVTTLTMPTGWWIIGRSPTRILRNTAERPFLFDVGDRVQFRRISRAEFDAAAKE
ncbi:MAG: allophanate hydrolase subunit 1 [Rhodobacteraceae bacterium]|nr:allophanate hydrolase subunit 1 [Paracoccaceae bacterium]